MFPEISKIKELIPGNSKAIILNDIAQLELYHFSVEEKKHIKNKLDKKDTCFIQRFPNLDFIHLVKSERKQNLQLEAARKAGAILFDLIMADKLETIQVIDISEKNLTFPFIEGILLSTYSFEKYKKEKTDFKLKHIYLVDSTLSNEEIDELKNLTKAVFYARNLVNEPLSYLTAPQFSKEIEQMGDKAGFSVEVFNMQKIKTLKMGGLLAVNRGSIDPPTFNILEWKPEKANNKKPVVLVGKGVVYDTGGLSLKPTAKSMDYMKCDMAGGAVVAATISALALNKIPVHVIGLIPATDNRPDGNAYVPGDIITMFDGTTVEIKNTDAEGRLILADALSYAKKYQPELVIDIATLTGAADIVAGNQAIVSMGNSETYLQQLKETGLETYERIIEVPLWEEYAKPLKSSVADLNNLGVREAQSTIAGKFLEHFTEYNWIHLDSAGVSFSFEKDHYIPEGGTGFGVRLLYNFLKNSIK